MSGAPDRCAAPLAASATEIGLQAGAATLPAISVREAGVGGDETIPARFEPIKLATGCENVVSEDGDVAQRPCEQRGDDLFREPRRAVLPDKIGRAHVRTPVTNAHPVCRHLLAKKKI